MHTIYNEAAIFDLYEKSLTSAKNLLSKLPIYCGERPNFLGLRGWVFEQTIQYCLRRELIKIGDCPSCVEQVSLGGRSKADLQLPGVIIEIKYSGCYDTTVFEKYKRHRVTVENMGSRFIFLTGQETYSKNRLSTVAAFGKENSFFLDTSNEWRRFIVRVAKLTKKQDQSNPRKNC